MTPLPPRPESAPAGPLPDIVALADTDLLLDRLGERAPFTDDLDDPILAALAVLAADVDLDEVAAQRTRRKLQQHGLWPPPLDATVVSSGRTIELPDVGPSPFEELISPRSGTRAPVSGAQGSASQERRSPIHRSAALTEPGLIVGIRLVPALAAAGAAIVLSMGAAAALTNGRSVNPAAAFATMVEHITGQSPSSPPATPPGSANVDAGAGVQPGAGTDPASPDAGAMATPSGLPASVTPSGLARLGDTVVMGGAAEGATPTTAPTPVSEAVDQAVAAAQAAEAATTPTGGTPAAKGQGPPPDKPAKGPGRGQGRGQGQGPGQGHSGKPPKPGPTGVAPDWTPPPSPPESSPEALVTPSESASPTP
jgi:hypothetical protein